MKYLALAFLVFLTSANASVVYDFSEVVINDDGTSYSYNGQNQNDPGNPTVNWTGDANLESLTYFNSGNSGPTTTSLASQFSGIDFSGSTFTLSTGFIQNGNHLANSSDPKFTDGDPNSQYYTGSGDAASYLSHGSRGMSFATGVNVVNGDPPQTFTIPISVIDPSTFGSLSAPVIIAGDIANGQSSDVWEFLAADDTVVATYSSVQGNWDRFGEHTIDRLSQDGTTLIENDENKTMAIMGFRFTDADLMNSLGWADVTQLRISIAAPTRTDYAFIALNTDAIFSTALVTPSPTPEPSTFFFMLIGTALLKYRRKFTSK